MESYVLDVGGRESGILLQNKTFLPVTGPVFSVTNTFHNKTINFVHAAWNKVNSQIVAGDSLGNIYLLYFQKNRFSLIYQLKICSTFLAFTDDKSQDILVALSDCTIVSLKSDSKVVRNKFSLHTSCVFHISFDKTGHTVLSCSKDQAILWDLESFHFRKLLSIKKDVDIIKVFFLQNKDIIISAFNDNTVFLWDFVNLKCLNQFICRTEDSYLNIKTIDASRDGKLLACAGKSNWFLVYDIETYKLLDTILLTENIGSVKQISFLSHSSQANDICFLCVLSSEGDVFIYDIKNIELIHKISLRNGKIISLTTANHFIHMLSISLQGSLELYDLEDFVAPKQVESVPKAKPSPVQKTVKSLQEKESKVEKAVDVDKKKLQSVLKNFQEYPEKHRFFIWSQLLELPHNEGAFKMFHQESLKIQTFVKDYSFMNPGIQKTFLRLMSMLACWHPVIQEINYFQCLVFPFVKVLHKNTIMCFEILITLISNWCQNWFLFCPFPPFNILCAVENIISFHDRELMAHFMKYKISAEIYVWSLLKTSFSEVFNKKEWLKFWDNVFSNALSFYLYAVAAYNISIRSILLESKSVEQFKNCYQKHTITASIILKKTYELQNTSPSNVDPKPIIGKFSSVPKDIYPTFFQMSRMKIDLETLARKKIIDFEINYLKQREDALEIKSNYLQELQKLQLLRRELLLDSIKLKETDALDELNEKLIKVQSLIQENLTNQIGMLKEAIGEEILFDDIKDSEKQYFVFQDYIKKLRRENKK